MVSVAAKLGFDNEELLDLGINLDQSRCKAGICAFDKTSIKHFDLMNSNKSKVKDLTQKLKCHPYIKDNVMPKVRYFW